MNPILTALLLGAGIAVVVEIVKHLGIPLEGKRKTIRLVVAVAALGIAYWTLVGQEGLAIEAVLAYAAGVVGGSEFVYQWIIKQLAGPGDK